MRDYLALGSNIGLTRKYCSACHCETLHKREACIHCGLNVLPVVRHETRRQAMPMGIRRPYTIEFRGEMLSLKEIAKKAGVSYATVTCRFRSGMRGEALGAPVPPMMARAKVRA